MWVRAPILFLSVYDFMLFSMTFVSLMITLFLLCLPLLLFFCSSFHALGDVGHHYLGEQ